jgi:hypothetical protein
VIEQSIFAKLKHLLPKAAARSIEAVCAAIGQLGNAGYGLTKMHPASEVPRRR